MNDIIFIMSYYKFMKPDVATYKCLDFPKENWC